MVIASRLLTHLQERRVSLVSSSSSSLGRHGVPWLGECIPPPNHPAFVCPCRIVSLQYREYLSRSFLNRLAGLHCHIFLSYGLQMVTRDVHRSSLRRFNCGKHQLTNSHSPFNRVIIEMMLMHKNVLYCIADNVHVMTNTRHLNPCTEKIVAYDSSALVSDWRFEKHTPWRKITDGNVQINEVPRCLAR